MGLRIDESHRDADIIYCNAGDLRAIGFEGVPDGAPDDRPIETTAGAVRALTGQPGRRTNKPKREKAPRITKPDGDQDGNDENPGAQAEL